MDRADTDEPAVVAETEAPASPRAAPADFMARVVAWPGPGGPAWVNLHWTVSASRGHGMRGRPFKELQEFMNEAQRMAANPAAYKEIYFCLSTQSDTGGHTNWGTLRAHRHASKALALKAIWIDIDCGEGKDYPTQAEGAEALTEFIAATQMPPPTAIVNSGRGLHAYWISDKPLTAEQWRPYAEGLKHEVLRHKFAKDAGLITDAARVLRVPGTVNQKVEHMPRPVKLLHLADSDYDFAATPGIARLATLVQRTPAKAAASVVPNGAPALELPAAFANGPSKGFALLDPADTLAAGLRSPGIDLPLSSDQLFLKCDHFKDSFRTHGAGQSQGLWHLTALACTFLDKGRPIFHTLSKGCPTYAKEECDAMFDRKVSERASNNLGWPSCKALEGEGAKCQGCPFRGVITSPLHLASRAAPSRLPGATEQPKSPTGLPVAAIRALHQAGASTEMLFAEFNKSFAVVKNGSEVLAASVVGRDVALMKAVDFRNMFANVRIDEGDHSVEVSRLWWKWEGRRQYFGRGVVFDPGGPLEIADDALNLWRGFGIEPKPGDWSLLRSHIFNVVCSGNQKHFDYLIRWMAYGVQHLDKPIGVAVALLGPQGAGKGIVARAFGEIFGKRHFAHIAHGDQLTGRFNASVATACAVFLDEAIWAADKKAEGVLKALITEPTLQMEAKFRDPIMVQNRLRIMVASNNDWAVPAGEGDRRWFVLKVAPTYAGQGQKAYFDPLYAEIKNGGTEAMLHDLLAMDLKDFDVRKIPHTAAKAQQQMLSLHGTKAWLYQTLQEGCVGAERWTDGDLVVSTDHAYGCYEAFCKQQREYRPDTKSVWSKKLREVFGPCMRDTRRGKERARSFQFASLAECRDRFAAHLGAPSIEWEADSPRHEVPPIQSVGDVCPNTEMLNECDVAEACHGAKVVDDATGRITSGAMQGALRRGANQAARDLAVVRQTD